MVRISDARMSGTAFGTIVLHVTPEAAVGGPLASCATATASASACSKREIALLVSDEELARRAQEQPGASRRRAERGYRKLFLETVTQADQGVDFDFLRAERTRRQGARALTAAVACWKVSTRGGGRRCHHRSTSLHREST